MLTMKVLTVILVVIAIQMDMKPINGQFSFSRLRRPTFNLQQISKPASNQASNPVSDPNSGFALPVQQPQPQDTARLLSQMINFGKLLSSNVEAPTNDGTSTSTDETSLKAKLMAKLREVYKPVVDKGLRRAAVFDQQLFGSLKDYLGDIMDLSAEGAFETVDKLTGTNQSSTT